MRNPPADPTALVTGATSGLGLAFARRLAAEGNDLVLVANRVGDRSRPVDLLVNNAGFGLGRAFTYGALADEERLVDVLVRAVLVLSHAAAGPMRDRGYGAIINVSSVSGFVVMGSYSAAKAWVTTFTEGLANELGRHGVQVTALCPGFVHTEFHQRAQQRMSQIPSFGWLDPDDVVDACLADVRRGRVISVPSVRYKVVVAVSRLAPRGLVRRVTGAMARRRTTPPAQDGAAAGTSG